MRGAAACLLVVLVMGFTGCKEAPAPDPAPDVTAESPVDIDDPQSCAPCHEAVVAEWQESMHARAHDTRDPIYAGVRGIRAKKEGAEIQRACAPCHTPRFGGDLDSPAAPVGVGCAGCHAVQAVKTSHDGHGAAALIGTTDGTLLGPHDVTRGVSPAHGTGPAPAHMKDSRPLCLTCHEALSSPTGIAMCTTGPEHRATGTESSCVDCHMPEVDGPSGSVSTARATHRSHRFVGPHRAWYQDDPSQLAAAASLEGTLADTRLTVTITNKTGHAMPTGFPGRQAMLLIVGKDAAGAEVWRPEAPIVYGKRYVTAEGKPTLAPYAAKLASDTRRFACRCLRGIHDRADLLPSVVAVF